MCRWALCLALSTDEDFAPDVQPDKNGLELTWETFAGDFDTALTALVSISWKRHAGRYSGTSIAEYFIAALEYGIAMLPRAIQNTPDRHIVGLVTCVTAPT